MGNDVSKQADLVVNQELIDKVKEHDGRELYFYGLSRDEREKLRDEHVITIIDNHVKADEVIGIVLYGCVGITDATLSHISTKCTQLKGLHVTGCHQITDDGITAIVEKIGNNLAYIGYSKCNRCTDAALQAVVQHCPNLLRLFAENTGITELPNSIGYDLPKLEILYLINNRIKRLPPSITLLANTLKHFRIDGNPLQHPPLKIAKKGIKAISEYFPPRPVEKIDYKTSLPIWYQRNFPLVSVHLNNSGDVYLDYNVKGKIRLKIHSIQHVDEKGTLLSTDVFDEDTKYDLTGTYSTSDKEEEAHDLLFTRDNISGEEKISAGKIDSDAMAPRGGGFLKNFFSKFSKKKSKEKNKALTKQDDTPQQDSPEGHEEDGKLLSTDDKSMSQYSTATGSTASTLASTRYSALTDQTGRIADAARGQQMPTLATKYSSGDQMGQIELESFIVTQEGRAGMDNDVLDVSNGDFKFNLKLTRDGKQQAGKKEQGHDDAEPHFVDVQLKIFTAWETAILPMGNHFYKIAGTGTFFYMPNIFYAFDEDSKRMKVQTMEDSYPKLSRLDHDRHQYFTFRFTNASEIFYDPDILQMLRGGTMQMLRGETMKKRTIFPITNIVYTNRTK